MAELGRDKSEIDANELGEVVDAIKDIKMAMYYGKITEAMDGNEYGKDYDEDGPKFYRGRSSTTGRFVHRAYTEPEEMRMYTEAGTHNRNSYSRRGYEDGESRGYMDGEARGYEEGRSRGYEEGQARGYEEGRARAHEENQSGGSKYDKHRMAYQNAGNDKEKRMESLNEYLRTIADDLTKMIMEMDTNEKQTVRNKLQAIQNKIS